MASLRSWLCREIAKVSRSIVNGDSLFFFGAALGFSLYVLDEDEYETSDRSHQTDTDEDVDEIVEEIVQQTLRASFHNWIVHTE